MPEIAARYRHERNNADSESDIPQMEIQKRLRARNKNNQCSHNGELSSDELYSTDDSLLSRASNDLLSSKIGEGTQDTEIYGISGELSDDRGIINEVNEASNMYRQTVNMKNRAMKGLLSAKSCLL